MTGDPLDRIREALDAICQDSLETTLAQTLENREWSEKQAVSSLFLIVVDGLDALVEVARAARYLIELRKHDRGRYYERTAWKDLDAALARLDGAR